MTIHDTFDILLVEDNPNDVELATIAFKDANFANHMHVVRDGAEALEFLFCEGRYAGRDQKLHPKLVLLDLKLPLIDGLEVLKRIKADKRTQAIPVVMMTTSHEESDMVRSYQLGVNSYIVKPVAFDKFLETTRLLGMYWMLINRPLL